MKKPTYIHSRNGYKLATWLFFFILFSSYVYSTVTDSELVQANTPQGITGTDAAGLFYSSDGAYIYGYSTGLEPGVHQWGMLTPYDLSTIYYIGNRTNFSNPYTGQNTVRSVFVAENGLDLFVGYDRTGNNDGYIYHFTMASANNISSLNMTVRNTYDLGGGTNTAVGSYGLYFTTDGKKMITQTCTAAAGGNGYIRVFNLTTAYNLTTGTQALSFNNGQCSSQAGQTSGFLRFTVIDSGLTLLATSIRVAGTGEVRQYSMNTAYNVSNLTLLATYTEALPGGSNGEFTTPRLYIDSNSQYYYFTGVVTDTSYYRKYRFSFTNTTVSPISEGNTTAGRSFIESVINPIINLFPDADDLTAKQKFGTMLFWIILLDVILLYCAHLAFKHVPHAMLYVVLILDVAFFLFFVSIGYVNVGILIILILAALVISYFKFRST